MTTNNTITATGDDNFLKDFARSSIKSCNIVIEHYDFVINDISTDISNPKLEATKGPVLAFLKQLRSEWVTSRDEMQHKLDKM